MLLRISYDEDHLRFFQTIGLTRFKYLMTVLSIQIPNVNDKPSKYVRIRLSFYILLILGRGVKGHIGGGVLGGGGV